MKKLLGRTWNPKVSLTDYHQSIQRYFSTHAHNLLGDLQQHKLEVDLFAAPEPQFSGHMVRRSINNNPRWYSDLYHSFSSGISRKNTLDALEHIAYLTDKREETMRYRYHTLMREEIFTHLTQGFVFVGQEVPANNVVRTYFLLNPTQDGLWDKPPSTASNHEYSSSVFEPAPF